MKTLTLDLPTMYADHHVTEVRRILLALPGVQDVYASSSFRAVELQYDPEQVDEAQIKARLEEAGYLGELPVAVETGTSVTESDGKTFMRHTAVYEQTRKVVGFAQKVPFQGRVLWPCPGVGVLRTMED